MPFDPNKPFDVVDEFDPSQPFEALDEGKKPKIIENLKRQASGISDVAEGTGESILESLKDLGLGASQGVTLGFADELAAAVASPFSDKTYRELQKEYEQAAEASQERSPLLFGGGEMLGGVLLPTVGGALLPALRSSVKAATLGQKAIQGAKIGAAAGGVTALGKSEGGSDVSDMLSETASGAASGAVLGGALPVAAEGVKGTFKKGKEFLSDAIESSDWLRSLKTAYGLGKEGIKLSPASAKENIFKPSATAAQKEQGITAGIVKKIEEADNALGKAVGQTIQDATEAGQKIQVEPLTASFDKWIAKAADEAPGLHSDPVYKRALKVLDSFVESDGETLIPEMTPTQIQNAKSKVGDLLDILSNTSNLNSSERIMREGLKNFSKDLTESLNSVKGYKEAAERFANFRINVQENILRGGIQEKFDPIKMSSISLEKRSPKLKSSLERNVIDQLIANKKDQSPELILKTMKDYLSKNKDVGLDFDDLYGQIQKASDLANVQIQAGTRPALQPTTGTLRGALEEGIAGKGQQFLTKSINRLGLQGSPVQKTAKVAEKVAKVPYKFFKLPQEALSSMGAEMQQSPNQNISALGKKLSNAIANNDELSKNQVLFVMAQNPSLRGLIGGDEE